jgi:hypothetical protein
MPTNFLLFEQIIDSNFIVAFLNAIITFSQSFYANPVATIVTVTKGNKNKRLFMK